MELVTGGDLFDYILAASYLSKYLTLWSSFANYILAEDRAGPLTAELCDAMAVCHPLRLKSLTERCPVHPL